MRVLPAALGLLAPACAAGTEAGCPVSQSPTAEPGWFSSSGAQGMAPVSPVISDADLAALWQEVEGPCTEGGRVQLEATVTGAETVEASSRAKICRTPACRNSIARLFALYRACPNSASGEMGLRARQAKAPLTEYLVESAFATAMAEALEVEPRYVAVDVSPDGRESSGRPLRVLRALAASRERVRVAVAVACVAGLNCQVVHDRMAALTAAQLELRFRALQPAYHDAAISAMGRPAEVRLSADGGGDEQRPVPPARCDDSPVYCAMATGIRDAVCRWTGANATAMAESGIVRGTQADRRDTYPAAGGLCALPGGAILAVLCTLAGALAASVACAIGCWRMQAKRIATVRRENTYARTIPGSSSEDFDSASDSDRTPRRSEVRPRRFREEAWADDYYG